MPEWQPALTGRKRAFVLSTVGLLLMVAGSMFAVDWMIWLYGLEGVYYAAGAKIFTSATSAGLALSIGRHCLDRRDRNLLLLAFLCIVPIDCITSVISVSKSLNVSGNLFMVAGGLSILAHLLLAIRHGRGFPYLRRSWEEVYGRQSLLQKYWILLLVSCSAVMVIALLWEDMIRIDHQVIGPVYTAFFCFNTWVAWETVRYRLYPRPNALLVALAMTGWYLTEIVGEISNVQIGLLSDVAFNLVWVFYGANVVLVALSGYRWSSELGQ